MNPTIHRHTNGQWFALTPDGGLILGSVGSKRHARECAMQWLDANWEY